MSNEDPKIHVVTEAGILPDGHPVVAELQHIIDTFLHDKGEAHSKITCIAPPLGCGQEITQKDLLEWDELTVQEYKQSAWCKECQEKVFKEE